MSGFKDQFNTDSEEILTESNNIKDPHSDFFTRLKQWRKEYLKQQIDFYAAELARFQQTTEIFSTQSNPPAADPIQREPGPQPTYYYEYVLPPVWKRFCAEVIDFLILLVIKLYLTYIFIDFFHGDKSFDFQNYWDNPALAVQVSREVVLLEVISRVVVCFYETYWLKGEPSATPGKKYMGLKVYRATNVFVVQEHPRVIVRAQPCTQLGWQYAILRAVLKNTFLGLFMFPVCLGFLFINHNRTGYDMLTNSLVVEHNPNPPRHELPM